MGRKLIFKTLFLSLILFIVLSFKSAHSINDVSINVNEICIKKKLKKIINNCEIDFYNRYNKKPNYIIVEYYKLDNLDYYSIRQYSFLYYNLDDFYFLNDNFIGGQTYENTVILLRKSAELNNTSKFIDIKKNKIKLKINFGGNIDSCSHLYWYKNKKINQIEIECN
jgi:hypothetical protein